MPRETREKAVVTQCCNLTPVRPRSPRDQRDFARETAMSLLRIDSKERRLGLLRHLHAELTRRFTVQSRSLPMTEAHQPHSCTATASASPPPRPANMTKFQAPSEGHCQHFLVKRHSRWYIVRRCVGSLGHLARLVCSAQVSRQRTARRVVTCACRRRRCRSLRCHD